MNLTIIGGKLVLTHLVNSDKITFVEVLRLMKNSEKGESDGLWLM